MRPQLMPQYRPSLPPHPITPTIPIRPTGDADACLEHSLRLPATTDTGHWTVPFRDGLPTPPNDMTGVAYNAVPSSHYAGSLDGLPYHSFSKLPSDSSGPKDYLPASTVTAVKPSTDIHNAATTSEATEHGRSATSIASYLQIPSSINNSKGSLAEFAAQMTCLFWFEKTAKLKAIEAHLNPALSLVPESIPSIGFQKWVTTILSTTQVSQNVILLALMFIYRLKKFNPGVRGKKGSEFRLMTVALMLGNKFLDDNTYTNKTWAEVSGISVQEIHVMEVEFLSNVRYNLFVSQEEWSGWHVKLGLFADYFNKASRVTANPRSDSSPPAPAGLLSPVLGFASRSQPVSPLSKLPSPPASGSLNGLPSWSLPASGMQLPGSTGTTAEPVVGNRKRTRDDNFDDHPVKRFAMSNSVPPQASLPPATQHLNLPSATLPPVPSATSAPPTLSVPNNSIPYLPLPSLPPASTATASLTPAAIPHLPTTAVRPMITSYNPSTTWIQPLPTTAAAPVVAGAAGLYTTPVSLPEPSRPTSSAFAVTSATVSPAVSAYSIHTPQTHLSPSFLLAHRNSPYRPVRTVNTLLIPPPSASLLHQRNVSFDHMHYQPLGKTAAERKTGLLPYVHHGAWPQGHYVPPIYHQQPLQRFSG